AGGALAAQRVRAPGPRHDAAREPVRGVRGVRVAVVGATGAVGTIMRRLLRERGFAAEAIVPFASERSRDRELPDADEPVRVLADDTIEGFDLALFSAGG